MKRFGCPVVLDGSENWSEGAYLEKEQLNLEYMLAPAAINELLDYKGAFRKMECPLNCLCPFIKSASRSDTNSKETKGDVSNEQLCVVKIFLKMYQVNINGFQCIDKMN